MKKLLFIKDGLTIGGTTSSFLSLLYTLKKQSDYIVHVWINNPENDFFSLSHDVTIIENKDLAKAFERQKGIVKKIWELIIYEQLASYIKVKRVLKSNPVDRTLIPLYQEMDIKRSIHVNQIDLSDYDAVITWEEFFPAYLLANAVKAKHKIAWIHPDYTQCGFCPSYDLPVFSKLDAIVAVSDRGKQSMQGALPTIADKIKYVSNGMCVESIRDKAEEQCIPAVSKNGFVLLTVARMQIISKALDRAIIVASRLKECGCRFRWYFVGDGEDKPILVEMIRKNKLEEYVVLLGAKENPYPYMKQADLFVLQSYYEGKPVTVDEALIIGTPVFVTNYASAREQVSEQFGWIVDNSEDAVFQGLREIITHQELVDKKRHALSSMDLSAYSDPSQFMKMLGEVLKDDNENI